MENFAASLKLITNGDLLQYFAKGILFTLLIAVSAIVLGLILGTILAFARNYCNSGPMKVFKWLSTAYIEIFRNTPLMLWMFICLVSCPTPQFSASFAKAIGLSSSADLKMLFQAMVALVLFTSSVMAEIVRGGLNSVSNGQFEAGYSQGFKFGRILVLIVLPQAFRNIIPTLLSQVITTIKDSSYVANIAYIELLGRIFRMIRLAPMYTGMPSQNVSDVFVLCGLACVVYFAINFTISCVVRGIQKKRAYAA